MIYYCEIADTISERINTPKIVTLTGPQYYSKGLSIILYSNRVWYEDDTGVHWHKNRFISCDEPVNMIEFFWIKLQAVNV